MPAVLLTATAVVALVIAAVVSYFAYAFHRYHQVPVTPRHCRETGECLTVGGFELLVRQLGSEHGGIPIVILHGGPGHSSLSFKGGMDFLAEHRHVLLYDQRGSGYSEVRCGDADYTVEALVEELDAVRREVLQADTIDLIGHSAGGAIAQRYAALHPSRVRRLVLVGSTTANNNMSNRLIWRTLGPGLYAAAMGLPPSTSDEADAWFQSDQLEDDTRRLFDPTDPSPIQDSGPTTFTTWFAVSQSFAGDDWSALLRELPTPTLVMYGEADSRYTGEPTAARICGLLPNARSVCIPTSGHWPFLENPAAFRAIVEDFLFADDSPAAA